MPTNKYAIIRYQTLDKCFRNPGRSYYLEDLLEEVNCALLDYNPESEGIKRRQLFADIKFMESENGWSVPLLKIADGKKKYYRYDDVTFSINNSPINEMESEQIKSALLVLSRFKGMPQFEWVNELIPKLEQSFGFTRSDKEIISFDANIYLKGIGYIGELFNAILYKKVLNIQYKSFKADTANIFELHPWYLKQFSNRWFLFGYNSAVKMISNLALDRIENIEECQKNYIENTGIDFQEYFEDIIGVSRSENDKPIELKLHFSPDQAPYVLTKPLHGSQKKKKLDKNGLLITIDVIPNYELEKLILSFGESVEVISPESFRNQISNKLKMALDNY